MKYKFDNRRATRGVFNSVPHELQGYLWKLITDLLISDIEVDYLQVFEFNKKDDRTLEITHKQEVPELVNTYFINLDSNSINKLVDKKIYVIDDITHSTMLFSDEY